MKKRKLNKRIFLLLTAAVLSSTAAFAGIAITEPKDGATVPLVRLKPISKTASLYAQI